MKFNEQGYPIESLRQQRARLAAEKEAKNKAVSIVAKRYPCWQQHDEKNDHTPVYSYRGMK